MLTTSPSSTSGPRGRESFTTEWEGTTCRYDGRYHDIVTSRRIVYSYAMYADDALISVSLATIEFAESGDKTKLTWTEQGAYLDGYNGADAPEMRKGGTIEVIEGLTAYLQRQGTSRGTGHSCFCRASAEFEARHSTRPRT